MITASNVQRMVRHFHRCGSAICGKEPVRSDSEFMPAVRRTPVLKRYSQIWKSRSAHGSLMTVSSRTDTVKRNRTLLLENNPQFAVQPARDQVPFCGFVRRGFRTYMLKKRRGCRIRRCPHCIKHSSIKDVSCMQFGPASVRQPHRILRGAAGTLMRS